EYATVPGRADPRGVDPPRTWSTSGSGNIESIEVHHLAPRCDEVLHELLLRVVAGIDLGDRAELRVRTEHEIDAAAGPLERVRLAIAPLEGVAGVGYRLPRRIHVEQVHEEVVAQRLAPPGQDAEWRPLVVRVQHPHAAHEHGRLRRAQRQQRGL